VQLLASGSMVNEVIEAGKLLKSEWGIDSAIWSVTSFSELHREAEDKKR
jgi:pyruvate dehydrogenase E1 component